MSLPCQPVKRYLQSTAPRSGRGSKVREHCLEISREILSLHLCLQLKVIRSQVVKGAGASEDHLLRQVTGLPLLNPSNRVPWKEQEHKQRQWLGLRLGVRVQTAYS